MTLQLSGEITIARAQELRATLAAAVAGGEPITIDLREASEVDMAGLQLLVAARESARAKGRPLYLPQNLRGKLVEEALQVSGLSEAFDREEVAHG